MIEYEVRESDGAQIVYEKQTEVYFLTSETYAKQSGHSVGEIEQKAREAVENNPGDQVPSKYQVLDLGTVGIKGVRGRYLIPAELAFYWLMSDCRVKAMLIGGEALAASIKEQYKSIGEAIKQGKKVRLKDGVKPIPVLEFHRHHEHFRREDIGTVLEYPTPRLYAGHSDDDAILLFKRWGRKNSFNVRVNVTDLELMED